MKTFEVICPVFNEEKTVPLFFERIEKVFSGLRGRFDCRLTFVDNSSADRTHAIIRDLCEKHDWIRLYVMSRNFGYQCSIECGIRNSDSDYTGVCDVDCEDPPELLAEFLQHLENGADLAYGERLDRPEPWIIKLMRKIFYRVTRATADERFILDMAEFSVMNRMVRESICRDRNSYPFIRASIGRVGFDVKNVPYTRHKRIAGETHYNLWGMTVFAIAGILSSSTLWLRIPVYVFPFWLFLSLIMMGLHVFTRDEIFYRLVVASGLAFLAFAMTGISLYLARVYKNGLGRPNYFVSTKKSILRGRQIA